MAVELLNHIARLWWAWTASMFWQVSLLILVIGCLDLLIRKWAWPHLRYALWSLILVKLLLPPTWSLPSGLVPELQPRVAQVAAWLNAEQPSRDDCLPIADCGWWIADSTLDAGPQFRGFAMSEDGSTGAEGLVGSVPPRASRSTGVPPVSGLDVPPMDLRDIHRQGAAGTHGRATATPYGVTTNAPETVMASAAANLQSGLPRSARNDMIHNPQFEWPFYAMAIWFLGTLTLGIWLWLRLHSTTDREAHRAAAASLPQSFYNHLADGAKRLGLRRIPRVVVTERVTSPAVFGVLRPVLLMPKGYLRRLSRRDSEHMLLHELAHIKRGDLVMHGLYLLLQIVYWYQPLLWLVRRHLHHLRELSCDGTVAELLREGTPAYRRTLLETARRMLTTSVEPGLGLLGLFEDSNYLLVRLNWLTKPTWRYSTMKRIIAATVALLMFACVLPMAQGQEPASNEEITSVNNVNTNEAVPASTEGNDQQAQDQLSQDIAKLEARLQQLRAQQQDLQDQLKALAEQRNQMRAEQRGAAAGRDARAPGSREAVPPEAREQLRRAQEQARRAQDEVKRAMKEADRARQEAMRAHVEARRHAQAEGQHTEAWGRQWEQWAESEPMQNWQRDMEKWGKQMEQWGQEFGRHQAAAVSGSASESEAREMPPMPPMPPMPAMPAVPPVPVHVPQIHVPEIHVAPVPPVVPEHADDRETVSRTDTRNIDLPAGMLLEVANEVGSINVHSGEGPDCKVVATVKAKADTIEKAQQIADQVELVVTPSDGKTRISMTKPEQENKRERHDCQVALDITVPRQVQLKVSQAVGNIRLTNLRGDIDASAKVGSIQAADVAGRVSLNADVGTIGFFAPRQFSAKVHAKAAMGSIQSDFPLDVVKPRGVAMGSSASGTIGDGEGELSLKTNVGSIGIRSQDAAPGRAEPPRAEPRPKPEPRPQSSSEREL